VSVVRIEPVNWAKDRLHEAQELGKEGVGDWKDWENVSDTLKAEDK